MFNDSDSLLNQSKSVRYVDQTQRINLKKTYYYDSESSLPVEVEISENQRPDPPSSVKAFCNPIFGGVTSNWPPLIVLNENEFDAGE